MTPIRIRSIRRYPELRLAVQQPGRMLVHSACSSLVTSAAASPGPTRTEGTAGMGEALDQLAAAAPSGRLRLPE